MSTTYKYSDPTIYCCPVEKDEESWILDLAFLECFLGRKIIKVQKLKEENKKFLRDCNFTVSEMSEAELNINYNINYDRSLNPFSTASIISSNDSYCSSGFYYQEEYRKTYQHKIITYTIIAYNH